MEYNENNLQEYIKTKIEYELLKNTPINFDNIKDYIKKSCELAYKLETIKF